MKAFVCAMLVVLLAVAVLGQKAQETLKGAEQVYAYASPYAYGAYGAYGAYPAVSAYSAYGAYPYYYR